MADREIANSTTKRKQYRSTPQFLSTELGRPKSVHMTIEVAEAEAVVLADEE